MSKRKEQLLQETLDMFIRVNFGDGTLSELEAQLAETCMGYGTAPDEIARGFEALSSMINRQPTADSSIYSPLVTVSTKQADGVAISTVSDNGHGIPEHVLDKIFQPFFITKPTGEGAGLGLSLAYDIVTKGHGGDLKVETVSGEGATFIIEIPINAAG